MSELNLRKFKTGVPESAGTPPVILRVPTISLVGFPIEKSVGKKIQQKMLSENVYARYHLHYNTIQYNTIQYNTFI